MRAVRFLSALIAAVTLGGFSAFAQVQQSGTVTAGHVSKFVTSGVIGDGGTATNGSLNAVGITATGTPFCINDALTTSSTGYHQFCLGANSLGGGLLSYNALGGASVLPFQVNINGTTTTLGTGTVSAGTAGQLPYYAGTGSTVIGNANLNVSSGTLTLGQAASVIGKLALAGSSSGTITIAPQTAAGTYNFNLPIDAGTTGYALVSGGGGSSPMTWASFGGSVSTGTTGQTAYYTGNGTTVGGTSALVLTTTTAVMSPSGAVTIAPSSASTMNNVAIGGSTPLAGTFTALTATGAVALSPSSANVVLSPTGTGVVTINPASVGTVNNVVIGGSTPLAGSFTTLSATGQISSGVSGVSLGSLALSGSGSGTVIVKTQAAAGSYNFNLPITAGTTGTPLLSGGGGASAMTYGSLSGNTSTFATTTGSLTNGHAAVFDASGNIVDGGTLPTGIINSGTANQLTYYAGTGTTLSGNANATVSTGALTMGITGSAAGSVILSGSSTGAITITGSGTTIGTYNFNLPTTAGTSGGPLLSGGGGAAAMTFGTPSGTTTKFGTVTGSLTNGNCIAADANGNLIDNGSTCGTGGSGTVTSSTAGQIAYYPASTNAVAGNSALTISGGAVTVGVTSTTTGSVKLAGGTSGLVTITPQAAAGTFNFNLPITAGSAGQVLTSGGGGASPMTWATSGLAAITAQTSNFNASSNTSYCVDTAGGAVTATLPASPANNDTILFVSCSNYSTNNLIIGRNGNTVQGLAADMTVNTDNASFNLVFITSYGWRMF